VLEIDILTRPTYGSRRRVNALISDPQIVREILRHLGLPAELPALAPPSSPPQLAFGFRRRSGVAAVGVRSDRGPPVSEAVSPAPTAFDGNAA